MLTLPSYDTEFGVAEDEESPGDLSLDVRTLTGRPELLLRLAVDVALGTAMDSLLEAYNLQHHELKRVMESDVFVQQLAVVRKQLAKEGATFRMKAQIQAEAERGSPPES